LVDVVLGRRVAIPDRGSSFTEDEGAPVLVGGGVAIDYIHAGVRIDADAESQFVPHPVRYGTLAVIGEDRHGLAAPIGLMGIEPRVKAFVVSIGAEIERDPHSMSTQERFLVVDVPGRIEVIPSSRALDRLTLAYSRSNNTPTFCGVPGTIGVGSLVPGCCWRVPSRRAAAGTRGINHPILRVEVVQTEEIQGEVVQVKVARVSYR
jgi:hypothetical protein